MRRGELGYSMRTRAYIDGVMNKIGLTHYTDFEYDTPEWFEVLEKFECGIFGTTEVGKLNENEWIARTCYQFEIDDFQIIKMYFNKKPSSESVRTALTIRNFERRIVCNEVFVCYECARLTHWLDTPGDICGKFNHLKDNYCGC